MYLQYLSTSFETISTTIPEWGEAADDMYEYYHLLTQAIDYFEPRALPEEIINQLKESRELLVDTLAELIQALPASSQAMSGKKADWIEKFYTHTQTLQTINHQTEVVLTQLQEQCPALQRWLDLYFGK